MDGFFDKAGSYVDKEEDKSDAWYQDIDSTNKAKADAEKLAERKSRPGQQLLDEELAMGDDRPMKRQKKEKDDDDESEAMDTEDPEAAARKASREGDLRKSDLKVAPKRVRQRSGDEKQLSGLCWQMLWLLLTDSLVQSMMHARS